MKKNKKQRFISDKISELKKQGKNQQESIAIALSMAENMLQKGGTSTNINEVITEANKINSSYRPIKKIQRGVTNSKGQEGVYYYYEKVPGDPGFDPSIHRDFVTNQSMAEQTFKTIEPELYNPELEKYRQLTSLKEGGELPKYQNRAIIQPNSSFFKGYDFSNPIKLEKQYPTTTYNPGTFNFSEQSQQKYYVPGQLNLNSSWEQPIPTAVNTPVVEQPTYTDKNIQQSKPSYYVNSNEENEVITPVQDKYTKTEEDIVKSNLQVTGDTNNYSQENIIETPQFERQTPPIQFANPYGGVDLNTASALFGQSLQQGDTLMGVASGAKLGLGLARNFMSGYSAGVDRNRVLNDYSSNMRNAMTGAETPVQFQEGGTANEQDQLLQQIAMMLQQGAQPEQIMQELINMGMPEQEAIQAIQMVMQQVQAPQQEQMMQDGGVARQEEVPVEMANAEIEDGEYVQDTEGVKYAEGAKHSEGGIPTQLENGARVLSDYKKVGKDLSKQFSEQLGFEVKASDTFATVLDKFNRKEEFDKKLKHLDEYADKMEKQEKIVKHDATLALNKQILIEEAQEDTQKLQELVKQQEGLFNMLFEAQEATKVMEEGGNYMQNGGTVNDLMAKYNISAEEATKLIPSMQDAGTFNIDKFGNSTNFQNLTDAATLGKMYGEARKYTPEEKEAIKKYYQTVVKDANSLKVLNDRLDNDTLVYNENLLKEVQTNKDIPLQYQSETEKNLFGVQTDSRLKDYLYASDFERKFGRPFGSSPEDESLIYKEIISALEKEGVKYHGSPVTNKGTELFGDVNAGKPKFVKEMSANKEYSLDAGLYKKATPEEKEAIARSLGVDKGILDQEANKITTGFIKFKPQGETAPSSTATVAETPMEIPTTPVVDVAQDKNRMAFLNLPDQTPMLPWAMQAPAMTRQTIYAPRWNEISPEQQLTDIQRGRVATAEQLSFLPDSQQASSLFALDANATSAQNKVRSETERYNQMARERTEAAEADQKTRQSAADVVAAQTYQQQLGNELESNEADWRSWYNRVQSNQMNNYLTTNEYNRSNAFNPDVQFTGQGYEVINTPTYSVDSAKIPMTQEPTKKKKSTKRFGK